MKPVYERHEPCMADIGPLRSAQAAGLEAVYVFSHEFDDEKDALAYAIHNQRDRRNLTADYILRCIFFIDTLKQAGRPEKLAQSCANYGKSAEETAVVIGNSPRTVKRARTVIDYALEEVETALPRREALRQKLDQAGADKKALLEKAPDVTGAGGTL